MNDNKIAFFIVSIFFSIVNLIIWFLFLYLNEIGLVIFIAYYFSGFISSLLVARLNMIKRTQVGIYKKTDNFILLSFYFIRSYYSMLRHCGIFFIAGFFGISESVKNYKIKVENLKNR